MPSADPGHLIGPADDGRRLVDVCRDHLSVVARRAIGPLISDGAILVDGAASAIAREVHVGQHIALADGVLDRLRDDGLLTPPSPQPLTVVHQDADLIVVDKPAGLHVHPMGPHREDTLLGRVLWHLGARPAQPWTDGAPAPVHRLDRPTSGLVAFSLDLAGRDRLQQAMESGRISRTYTALVHGDLGVGGDADEGASRGTIELPIGKDPDDHLRQRALPVEDGGREARSHWRVLTRRSVPVDGDTALPITTVQLRLDTGRTHQLRVHMSALGAPIVGDTTYGAPDLPPALLRQLLPAGARGVGDSPAIALTATVLELPHPGTGQPLLLRSTIWADASGMPGGGTSVSGPADDGKG